MKLEIVAPMGKIFEGEVKSVTLPGSDGEMGVLDGHSPLVTTLKAGVIDIKKDSGEELVAINWGYADISNDSINIVVDEAIPLSASEGHDIADNVAKAKKLMTDFADSTQTVSYTQGKIESAARNLI
jgi:F-type H+-transporting ATPase subunit epsilon